MPHMNYYMLTDLLNYHKVDIYTDTKVLKTTSDGVVVETDGTQKVLPAKTVIASIGYIENNMLYEQLKDSGIQHWRFQPGSQYHVCNLECIRTCPRSLITERLHNI